MPDQRCRQLSSYFMFIVISCSSLTCILFSFYQKISSNFCADGDSVLDSASESNRTSNSSSEELENSFHPDTVVDHRLNLSDMDTQFPAVNILRLLSFRFLWALDSFLINRVDFY